MAFVTDNKETILGIIDGWSGKLTYDLLSEKLQSELGLKRACSGPFRSPISVQSDQ